MCNFRIAIIGVGNYFHLMHINKSWINEIAQHKNKGEGNNKDNQVTSAMDTLWCDLYALIASPTVLHEWPSMYAIS